MRLKAHTASFKYSALSKIGPKSVPLGGVSVSILDTPKGTVTDFDGNYEIEANSTDILVFSYIGFIVQNVPVENQTTINIVLQENTEQLSEVVVTA